jgi:hypothetical protein
MADLHGVDGSRRDFLRQLGKTLLVGVGVMTVAAMRAPDSVVTCCRDDTCPTCPGAKVRYSCRDSVGNVCGCTCHANVGRCYTYGGVC